MRLTRKLTLALACAILLVLGINAALRIRLELDLFEQDMQRDSRLLGRTIAGATARIWKRVGEVEALDLVDDANERESNVMIRWVWLDAPDGDPHAPDVPRDALRGLRAGRDVVLRWPYRGDEAESLYTYVPAPVPGARTGAVELREALAESEAVYVRQTVLHVSLTTVVLVGACAMVALGLGAVLVGRPVRKLVAHARRIGAGDLSSRIALRQRDEIGELATEMNTMSEHLERARSRVEAETHARLDAVEQLRHADRLTTVGKLAAGIAHEVGTPLNVITGYAQLVTDEYPPDSAAHQHATIVAQQAHRVAAIIRQLLDFARPRTPKKTSHELGALARQVAAMLQSMAQRSRATLTVTAPAEPLSCAVDAGQLQQVLTNLVVNAIHAMPGGGAVAIGVERARVRAPTDPGGPPLERALISVRDAGSGIPPEVLPRIFEPFFTTKDPGDGSGLGLSVSYGIVKEHGGWIEVATELGKGTCFSIYLPLEAPA
ncbi:MAG: ATP-binding protein [Myxococcota bacterium]